MYELFSECRAGDSFSGLCAETPEKVRELIVVLLSALVARFAVSQLSLIHIWFQNLINNQ